jgi:hypothetical protein
MSSAPTHRRPAPRRRRLALGLAALVAAPVGIGLVATPSADAALCLPLLCTPITATTPVAIADTPTPQAGHTLTLTPPTWSDSAATTTYQWQVGGAAVTGETGTTYRVRGADVGKAITVVATAVDGSNSGTSTSTSVTATQGEAIAPTAPMAVKPTDGGSIQVGSTIEVTPGTWTSDTTPAFTFQWYRSNGKVAIKIPDATGSSYTVTNDDLGRKLAAVVTGMATGYTDGQAVSQVVSTPRIATTTRMKLSKGNVHQGSRARARAVVVAADRSSTAGRVVVFDGKQRIGSYKLTGADQGVVMITLPTLALGVHDLHATYAGDTSHASSSSTPVRLTVTT